MDIEAFSSPPHILGNGRIRSFLKKLFARICPEPCTEIELFGQTYTKREVLVFLVILGIVLVILKCILYYLYKKNKKIKKKIDRLRELRSQHILKEV